MAAYLRAGLKRAIPDLAVQVAPVADGGDGTVEAALASGYRRVTAAASGPLGDRVSASIAVRDDTAVVEMAQASGLHLLATPDPLRASSFGTGELIRAALDAGAATVILGVGGSASTDGGAGMLEALGARLTYRERRRTAGGGGLLADLDGVDLSGLDPRIGSTEFVIASDVDNPLLGTDGAAAIFAPQKGADADDVALLEAGLCRWADLLAAAVGADHSTEPGAGAAGGVGFGAMAGLGAHARPGIELLLGMIGFADLLSDARLVVTGEGSLDEQSLRGKAPVGVAGAAAEHGVPAVAVAGVTSLSPAALSAAGFAATYTLHELEPDLDRCMTEPGPLLERIGERIAGDWLHAL
ncbi:MAG: glycerate kinase [Actinomycetota bacterium]|nr:glycerate kinase [Actinomycetota bacterium]